MFLSFRTLFVRTLLIFFFALPATAREFFVDDNARADFETGDLTREENLPKPSSGLRSNRPPARRLDSTLVTRAGDIFRARSSFAPSLDVLARSAPLPNAGFIPLKSVPSTKPFPYRAIGRLAVGCTGTLVSARHVLTAGHCVYNVKTKKWYRNLDFSPGRNGKEYPHGTLAWENVFAPDGWTKDHDWEYDYAIVELKEDVEEKIGWLMLKPANGFSPGAMVTITGYPAAKSVGTPWEASCPKTSEGERKIYYRCETHGGMSGSAVRSSDAQGSARLIEGIHAYGGATTNSATRISKDIHRQLLSWMELSPETPVTPPVVPPVTSLAFLAGDYRGTLQRKDPASLFPGFVRLKLEVSGSSPLSASLRLYFEDFDSDEYVSVKIPEAHYDARTSSLVLRNPKEGLVLRATFGEGGVLIGNIFTDGLGEVGTVRLER